MEYVEFTYQRPADTEFHRHLLETAPERAANPIQDEFTPNRFPVIEDKNTKKYRLPSGRRYFSLR